MLMADDSMPMSNVYGFPVPDALKLIRVICAAGTNMAANMVSQQIFSPLIQTL